MSFFYAVAVGRATGVFESWDAVKPLVAGYQGARYKKFKTRPEAEAFVKTLGSPLLAQWGVQPTVEIRKDDTKSPHAADALVVFTDGACTSNGRRGARGGYAVVWPNHPALTTARALPPTEPQTNNRAEIAAVLHALAQADVADPSRMQTLYIYTDSELVINTATKWIGAWRTAGWKRVGGEELANVDQIKTLDARMQGRRIVWRHVAAHTGAPDWASTNNAAVDELARQTTTTMKALKA